MTDKENRRKCFKCGCSPIDDNVKLFRFPKPGTKNLVRCELWAKYVFPESNSTLDTQRKLYSEHRMLCQKHFQDADFIDSSKQRLLRSSYPHDINDDSTARLPIYTAEPQPGCSQPLRNITNAEYELPISSVELQAGLSQSIPLKVSTNTSICVPGSSLDLQIEAVHQDKEKMLYSKCRKYMNSICQLRNRIKRLKSNSVLNIISDDIAVKKLSKRLTPAFALLLQGQIRNFKRKITGQRWSKEEKITALRVYKRSPTCYRLLRRLFKLPSPSTLKTLLNKIPFCVGVNQAVFEILKKYNETQQASENVYILMFDEMSLKKHLNYNPKEDFIEGFQDHGSQGRSPLIAGYALVFMIAGIRRRVKQPIAHYFSSGFSTADRLAVLIKEVLQQCFQSGVNIAAIVCDMDGVNRRALSILGASPEHPHITVHDKEIVTLFDPPHLLKCFRNLFMKYDIECVTNISSDNEIGRGVAKWSHIKEFYELDNKNPNFVFAPAIKKDHLNPNTKQKMRVKLAAQILSHSVAGGMFAKISGGEMTADAAVTANLVSKMDQLFDAVNSDSSDLRRGKPYATNLRRSSPHLRFFQEMKVFFSNFEIYWMFTHTTRGEEEEVSAAALKRKMNIVLHQ